MSKRKINQRDVLQWQIGMLEKRLEGMRANMNSQVSIIEAYLLHPTLSNAVGEIKSLYNVVREAEIALRQLEMLKEILLTDEEEKQAIQATTEPQGG